MNDYQRHLLMDASQTMRRCEWPDKDTRLEAVKLSQKLDELIAREVNEASDYEPEMAMPF